MRALNARRRRSSADKKAPAQNLARAASLHSRARERGYDARAYGRAISACAELTKAQRSLRGQREGNKAHKLEGAVAVKCHPAMKANANQNYNEYMHS